MVCIVWHVVGHAIIHDGVFMTVTRMSEYVMKVLAELPCSLALSAINETMGRD